MSDGRALARAYLEQQRLLGGDPVVLTGTDGADGRSAGQAVTASGWVLPLDGSDQTKHFLLTRRTPVCMFCPPGEPNEVAEVISPTPITWTDKLVTVSGLSQITSMPAARKALATG